MAGLSIDPVTGLQNATNQPATKAPTNDLNQVDFMKLIIAQMQNQNPLEPQSDTEFMSQMAQFEALTQMQNVAQGMKVLQGVNELASATAMIGRTVTGKQVDATAAVRDMVGREQFQLPFSQLTTVQQAAVNNDSRVQQAANDARNAGLEVTGKVDRVVVGPDGIPSLWIGGKVVDMFTVSGVQ